ncbi:histidine phosphatase family protein [Nocardia rhamnosiphila]
MSPGVLPQPPSYLRHRLVGPLPREMMGGSPPRGLRMIMIRHGETGSHACDDVEGPQGGPGLSPRGHRQALGVANRLAIGRDTISAVYTTPLTCTVQTANPIATALELPLLRELPVPDCTLATHPGSDASWSAWVRQMGACIDRISDRHPCGIVVLVCHRASIVAAEQYFLRASLEHVTVVVDHASITEWERCPPRDPGTGRWQWRRLRHNDIAHRIFDALEE